MNSIGNVVFERVAHSSDPGEAPQSELNYKELEEKRKQRAKVAFERKKELAKMRSKAEKTVEETLSPHLEILAPITY